MENNPGTSLQYLVKIDCYHNNLLGENFVIMTFEQMDDYDKFKEQELEKEYSYLKSVSLLELFLSEKGRSSCYVKKFGITYHCFHETERMNSLNGYLRLEQNSTKMQVCKFIGVANIVRGCVSSFLEFGWHLHN